MIDGIKESKKEINGSDVLYCAIFSHGLVKIGATKRIESRIEELKCHGVLADLLLDVIVVPCEGKNGFSAESILIEKCASAFGTYHGGSEVFKTKDRDGVRRLMLESIDEAPVEVKPNPLALSDLDKFNELLDLRNAATKEHAAIMAVIIANTVLSFESAKPNEWEDFMDNCPQRVLESVVFFMKMNNEMLADVMSKKDRREAIVKAAYSYKIFR